MRTGIKSFLDKILHPIGLNIERYFGNELALKSLINIAKEYEIDLILDIGANSGQFSKKIINAGYQNELISFEPLSSAYGYLLKNSKSFPKWSVYEKCAIGDFDGEVDINISLNNHSSSILQINKEHTDAAPSAVYIDNEKVKIFKLDSIQSSFSKSKNILLKIDTQGFEKNVIDGARVLIHERVKIIQLEMSLLSLYEGVFPFDKMVTFLNELG